MNHQDIIATVRSRHPELDSATASEQFLPFLLDVVASLPVDPEQGKPSLYRKDGGSEIVFYPPAGVNVSISRIAYEHGYGVKILSNAGPQGTNGPIWDSPFVDDPVIHYVEMGKLPDVPPGPPPTPPDPGVPIDARLHNIELQLSDLQKVANESFAKLDTLATKQQIETLQATATQAVNAGVARILAAIPRIPFFRGSGNA